MDPDSIAMQAVRHLAAGGRGSCTAGQRRAGAWAAEQLRAYGAQAVALEPFQGAPSTYRPFVAAFGLAALGSAAALAGAITGSDNAAWALGLGALLNLLGAYTMFAESDFLPHPVNLLLPRAPAQNVVASIPAQGKTQRRVVLCAHLDSHRTPVFYSSAGWQRLFGLLVSATFLSMALGGLVLAPGVAPGLAWLGWIGVILLPVQAFALLMMASADHTPFSPGANDDASGVGVILGLAARLQAEPLAQTDVRIALTDCEETGAWGMRAYLDRHATELGSDALYIILDEVGLDTIKFLRNDGLIRKHATHPRALELLRRAAAALPEISTSEQPGLAYTDALVATKRGLAALTLCSVNAGGGADSAAHWHQMSDTPEYVSAQALENVHQFVWHLLKAQEQAGA